MFENYEKIYPESYKILNLELTKNTISHAYLFEINDLEDYTFIYSFIKKLILKNHNSNSDKIIKQIDKNLFDSIKIIETDTKTIKKEQILNLKADLKTINISSNYYIYVIKEANKMNDSSANTLLKFLEEPQDNIIGILVTDNIYNVISTILSRCQVISLKEKNSKTNKDFSKYIDIILELVYSINVNKFYSIAYLPNYFKEMEYADINLFLDTMLFFYRDLLNYILNSNLIWFNEYKSEVTKIIKDSNIYEISKKIDIIIKLIDESNTNINKNMLFDKMIIELSGDVNSVKC